jgi:thiol-disulfide isomerase/thioredoxin
MPEAARAKLLVGAIRVKLREPKGDARNAELEKYDASLDRLSDAVLDDKFTAHATLNGYYRGDDIDRGIVAHSTALLELAKKMTPEQRTKAAPTLINAYTNLAEVYAGQEENDRALETLRKARAEFADLPYAEARIKPEYERYSLVGTPAPPIESPRWINTTPGRTSFDVKGKVTLLEFTAHWCGPCRESYPGLQRLQKRLGSRGFQVVLATQVYGYIGTERNLTPDQEFERDKAYFIEHGFGPDTTIAVADQSTFTRGADGRMESHLNPNDSRYKVGGIPQIHIIDRQGIHRLIMVGYDDANEEKLAGLIDRLLNLTTTSAR